MVISDLEHLEFIDEETDNIKGSLALAQAIANASAIGSEFSATFTGTAAFAVDVSFSLSESGG